MVKRWITHRPRAGKYRVASYRQRHRIGYPGPHAKPKGKLARGSPGLLRPEKVYHTIYTQIPKTGLMKGRKKVEGIGDRTGILLDPSTGRIFGRSPKR